MASSSPPPHSSSPPPTTSTYHSPAPMSPEPELDSTLSDFPSPCKWPKRFAKGTPEYVTACAEAMKFREFLKPYALEWESEVAKKHKDGNAWVRIDVVPQFLAEFRTLKLSSRFNHPSIVEVSYISIVHLHSHLALTTRISTGISRTRNLKRAPPLRPTL
jgi:hypothetical protein